MKVQRSRFSFRMSPLEARYLRVILMAMIVPTTFAVAMIYFAVWENLAREMLVPEAIATVLSPAFDNTTRLLLISLPVVFTIMLLYAAVLSNRLLGPLQRIERDLTRIARSGDFSERVMIREKDELRRLVRAINRVIVAAERRGGKP